MRLKSSESTVRIHDVPLAHDARFDEEQARGNEAGSSEVDLLLELDPHLVAALSPNEPLAQAARNLRAMISAARLENGERPKVVVLLGADADAETALLSANIAIASAQSGWRTLLVDTDAADPVQHRLFGLPYYSATEGASGEPELIVRASSIPRLALATAKHSSSASAPMQMHSALRQVTEDFDLTIVDASHRNKSSAPTYGADAAVVVLRRDFTAVADTQEIVHSLRTAGTEVLGTFMFK
jgi:protein-tyrosine kinase